MLRKVGSLALLPAAALLFTVPLPRPARAANPAAVEAEIIRLTNVERRKVGAPPLRANPVITGVAERYAVLMTKFTPEQMLGDNGTAGHHLDGLDVGERLTNAGYGPGPGGGFYSAENIAWNFPTADAVVQFWVHHPGHRENLLDPNVTEIGVGVAFTPQGEIRYDQVFARPRP